MSTTQAAHDVCAQARHSAPMTQGTAALAKQSHTTTVHFAPDHPVFADHFPGAPVVPGSCLLDALGRMVAQRYGCPAPVNARNVRFRRFVPPGTHTCVLEPQPDGYRCTILVDGTPAMTGTLLTTTPPPAAHNDHDGTSAPAPYNGLGGNNGPAPCNDQDAGGVHAARTSDSGPAAVGGVQP